MFTSFYWHPFKISEGFLFFNNIGIPILCGDETNPTDTRNYRHIQDLFIASTHAETTLINFPSMSHLLGYFKGFCNVFIPNSIFYYFLFIVE